MVKKYQYIHTIEHRDPQTGYLYDMDVQFSISKNDLDEFTTEAIAYNYIGDHLLSKYPPSLLPTDQKKAIILPYNRQSVELMDMKQKFYELIYRES